MCVWHWHKHRHRDQRKITESSEINSCIDGQLIYNEVPRIYNGKVTVSSINSIGRTGKPHAEEWNWTTTVYHTQKSIKINEEPIMS